MLNSARKRQPKMTLHDHQFVRDNSKISVTMLFSLEISFQDLHFDLRFSSIFHLDFEIQDVKHRQNSVKCPIK